MPNLIEPVQLESVPVKWKRGQIHPETGLVFFQYHKQREEWVTPERLAEKMEGKRRCARAQYHKQRAEYLEKNPKQEVKTRHNDAELAKRHVEKRRAAARKREALAKEDPVKLRKLRDQQKKKNDKMLARDKTDPEFRARRREYARKYHAKRVKSAATIEKERAYRREWSRRIAQDPDKAAALREWRNEYCRKRRQEDPVVALRARIASCIGGAFSRKGLRKDALRTSEILGCSFAEFRDYIVSLFLDGMTVDNRKEWHIDHIVPISLARNEEEMVSLNHYRNLRPLWGRENLQKSDTPPTMEECPEYLREWLKDRLADKQ